MTLKQGRGLHRRTPDVWAAMTQELGALSAAVVEQRNQLALAHDLIRNLAVERDTLLDLLRGLRDRIAEPDPAATQQIPRITAARLRSPVGEFSRSVRIAQQSAGSETPTGPPPPIPQPSPSPQQQQSRAAAQADGTRSLR